MRTLLSGALAVGLPLLLAYLLSSPFSGEWRAGIAVAVFVPATCLALSLAVDLHDGRLRSAADVAHALRAGTHAFLGWLAIMGGLYGLACIGLLAR